MSHSLTTHTQSNTRLTCVNMKKKDLKKEVKEEAITVMYDKEAN